MASSTNWMSIPIGVHAALALQGTKALFSVVRQPAKTGLDWFSFKVPEFAPIALICTFCHDFLRRALISRSYSMETAE